VVNHVSVLIIKGDMTVLISPARKLGEWNFVSTHEYGPNFLTCWRVRESLFSISSETRWSPTRISRVT